MPVIGSGTQLEHQVQEAPQVLLSLVAVSSRQSFQLRPSSLTADALEPSQLQHPGLRELGGLYYCCSLAELDQRERDLYSDRLRILPRFIYIIRGTQMPFKLKAIALNSFGGLNTFLLACWLSLNVPEETSYMK